MLDCVQFVVVSVFDAHLEHLVCAYKLSAVAVNVCVHLHNVFHQLSVRAELLRLRYPNCAQRAPEKDFLEKKTKIENERKITKKQLQ